MEASLRSISSVTMAGSVSICVGAPAVGGPPGTSSGMVGTTSPRSTTIRSASPVSGSDLPNPSTRALRLRGRSQVRDDVDEKPPAGVVHRPESRQLPHGKPQGLDRVRHHLLMADGDKDVLLFVSHRRDGEQRGDRPALDDLEAAIDQAPFDVLGAAEVRLDPPAQLREPHDLRVGQCSLVPALRLDRHFPRSASRRGVDGELFGAQGLGDDFVVTHLVDVRVHPTRDQGLAETEARLHGCDLPVRCHGVGREEDTGRLREDHLLHDDGHVEQPVVEAISHAIGHGPLGEQ